MYRAGVHILYWVSHMITDWHLWKEWCSLWWGLVEVELEIGWEGIGILESVGFVESAELEGFETLESVGFAECLESVELEGLEQRALGVKEHLTAAAEENSTWEEEEDLETMEFRAPLPFLWKTLPPMLLSRV
eukprot:Gb_23896 [translate_table: standard]